MSGGEILDNGTRVLTAPRAAFGSDALLLGRFAQPRRAERALDMCSGCGIISLLWHDAGHRGPCTALELDPDASALCVQAVAENGIDHITPAPGRSRENMILLPATRPILRQDPKVPTRCGPPPATL